jgi:D-lactate dehydrogenase
MGAARGDRAEPLPTVTTRLLQRAGFAPRRLPALAELCCGQPFESKGLAEVADRKSEELLQALLLASEDGRIPVLFDTSPCAYRMKRHIAERGASLRVLDIVEGLDELVLPRLTLTSDDAAVAVHPVCSLQKMGLSERLLVIAQNCSRNAFIPPGSGCCGWAGDKGFTVPELNAHALRDLRAQLPGHCHEGVSTSRTCEIGLSDHGGIRYRSIVHLVERAASARTPDSPA